jgi:hypothetical protein
MMKTTAIDWEDVEARDDIAMDAASKIRAMIASARDSGELPQPISGGFALWNLRRRCQIRFRSQAKQVNGHLRVPETR